MGKFRLVALLSVFLLCFIGAAFAAKGGGGGGKYSRIVTVDITGAGDFTSIAEAYASITDATDKNLVLVKIMPGSYPMGTGSLNFNNSYIHVQGSGKGITILAEEDYSGVGITAYGSLNISELTMLYPDIPAGYANYRAIYAYGPHGITDSVNISNLEIIMNSNAVGDFTGIWLDPGSDNLSLTNVSLNITTVNGSATGIDSRLYYNTAVNGLSVSVSSKFYSTGVRFVNNNQDSGTYSTLIDNMDIFVSAQYYPTKGAVIGSTIFNGLTANISNSSLRGTEFAIDAITFNTNNVVISDSMIDGPLRLDPTRSTLTNCVDATGNPINL